MSKADGAVVAPTCRPRHRAVEFRLYGRSAVGAFPVNLKPLKPNFPLAASTVPKTIPSPLKQDVIFRRGLSNMNHVEVYR